MAVEPQAGATNDSELEPVALGEPAQPVPTPRPRAAAPDRQNRLGKRRTGPARERVAANDDVPSIGALMYALQQQPSSTPFYYAAIGTGLWAVLGLALGYWLIMPGLKAGGHLVDILIAPQTIGALVLVLAPIGLLWFFALLVWRAQELRLMSSAMTEVAVRLAEPDRMAEQSIAALGQSVRRQVAAMNDAISRAIGRAGELEVLVQNEVSALERSYDENENRIRNLIDELVSEREALAGGSERLAETLRGVGTQITDQIQHAGASVAEELSDRGNVLHSSMLMLNERIGAELPTLLERLSDQQGKLATIVDSATSNLDTLQLALDERTDRLDSSLGMRTKQLQGLLQDYSTTIDTAIAEHADTLSSRLGNLTQTIENTNVHIENVLAGRTDALDAALVERTKAIDAAFANRMAEIDDSILRSSMAVEGAITRGLKAVEAVVNQGAGVVDSAIGSRVELLRNALDRHATTMGATLRQQSDQLESTLVQGLDAMRRNTETIAQQSNQTVNGLSVQGRILREVSEGLLSQLQGLVDRFDQQGRLVAQASSVLENSQGRLSGTARETSGQLAALAKDINTMTATVQAHMANLPGAARDSASGVRLALQDQIRALDQLSGLSREQRGMRDVTPAEGQEIAPRRPLATNLTERLQFAVAQPFSAPEPAPLPVPPPSPSPGALGQSRDGWSLGDLLARASQDDAEPALPRPHIAATPAAEPREAQAIDVPSIAAAIEPATAGQIWVAYRSNNRSGINRSAYSPAGQATFDQLSARARTDGSFRSAIERYMGEFEGVLVQSDQRDPSGRTSLTQIVSEAGRVYVLLAHASGRLGS